MRPITHKEILELSPSETYGDLTTLTYSENSLDIDDEESIVHDLFFKPDGTKMFITGEISDSIIAYDLSTPWDVSTATYNSEIYDAGDEVSTPRDLFFKPDGTKVFLTDSGSDAVYAYDLSTPWDVSSATYNSETFDISSQDGTSTGIFFKPDGTKMFMVGFSTKRVYAYDLSTAWDVSTASYNSENSQPGSASGSPQGISFNEEGTKLYIVDASNDIYAYDLSTAWDISSPTYNSETYNMDTEISLVRGLYFRPEIEPKLYASDSTNNKIYQYNLGTTLGLGEGGVIGGLQEDTKGHPINTFSVVSTDVGGGSDVDIIIQGSFDQGNTWENLHTFDITSSGVVSTTLECFVPLVKASYTSFSSGAHIVYMNSTGYTGIR